MKFKIFVVLIAVAAAWVLGRGGPEIRVNAVAGEPGREEIRRGYKLSADARVEVRGINGSVSVEAVDSDEAEVYVLRTARDRESLERHQLVIEQTPTSLTVLTRKGGVAWWKKFTGGDNARSEVRLRVPRGAEVTAKGVNGPVVVGEMAGAVRVGGVNGRVEVGRASGAAEVSGVNGSVKLGVARLGGEGLSVKGVNGSVEVRVADELNADLEVKGLNGSVTMNLPNLTEQERRRSRLRARVGAGGTPFKITGVNGGVLIESGAPGATRQTFSSLEDED